MLMVHGKMRLWVGMSCTNLAFLQSILSCVGSTLNFNVAFTAVPLISKEGPQRHEIAVAHESSKNCRLRVTARTLQGDIREDFSRKERKSREELEEKPQEMSIRQRWGYWSESTG
jgi:hypothetical protein